jgi:hypothetical protein
MNTKYKAIIKELGIVILLLYFSVGNFHAQPWTGQTRYDNNSIPAILSSGSYVSINPGFVMAGYLPTTTNGNYNFLVDKVDVDGQFNSSVGEFHVGYMMNSGGLNCGTTVVQELNCYGVSIIETNPGGGVQYALAATFDSGVVFALLDNGGNVVTSKFLAFTSTVPTSISKPLICESSTLGNYYICGNYTQSGRDYLYAMHIDNSLFVYWQNQYDLGSATQFRAHAIMESPYLSTDVVIAGGLYLSGINATDGFVMLLDDASVGAVKKLNRYHGGSTDNEEIWSLAKSNSVSGYVIGGSTDANLPNGQAWVTRLTSALAIAGNSYIYKPASDGTAGHVVAILERLNTSAAYEYFALSDSPANVGMIVLKLDNSLNKFATSYSEFLYDDNAGLNTSIPAAMSFENTGGGVNEGIHIFGTTDFANPEDFYLVQGCFNGPTANCAVAYNNMSTGTLKYSGPTTVTSFNAANVSLNTTYIYDCTSTWALSAFGNNFTPNNFCTEINSLPTTWWTGSNNRAANVTGVAEKDENSSKIVVQENPENTTATILFSDEVNSGSLDLYAISGSKIKSISMDSRTVVNGKSHVEFKTDQLAQGFYFVEYSAGQQSRTAKFAITH